MRRPAYRLSTFVLLLGSLTGCSREDSKSGSTPPPPGTRPNVVIFLVDTLRADAVGWGGAKLPATPKLDAWARDAVLFDRATTPAGWTRPAVASLFTALPPAAHGVQDKNHLLPDSAVTLAEQMKSAGYFTQAFVTNFAIAAPFGMAQGFDRYRFFDRKKDVPRPLPEIVGYVPVPFIDREVGEFFDHPPAEPFLLYLHTTDPHQPYLPPDEFRKFGDGTRSRYAGELLMTDHYIGGWLERMRSSGLDRRTIVVFTADHGEEFQEHGGESHGSTVYEEIVRVPLAIKVPGLAAGRRSEQVSLLDIAPTLLDLCGIDPDRSFTRFGRSMRPLLEGTPTATGWDHSFHELIYPEKGIAFSYRERSLKLVSIARDQYGRHDLMQLFDLEHDPGEQHDLARQQAGELQRLNTALQRQRMEYLSAAISSQPTELDPQAMEQLRALGYVR